MRGATDRRHERVHAILFQSTLLMRGATRPLPSSCRIPIHFNPRSSCEERLPSVLYMPNNCSISIHAPHARSDVAESPGDIHERISIHAPHARSDALMLDFLVRRHEFQSTLLMRGATDRLSDHHGCVQYFNPRSSCEERPGQSAAKATSGAISIHAPHARSDLHQPRHAPPVTIHFNPRSSCEERRENVGAAI